MLRKLCCSYRSEACALTFPMQSYIGLNILPVHSWDGTSLTAGTLRDMAVQMRVLIGVSGTVSPNQAKLSA